MSTSYSSNPTDDAQIFTTISEDEQIYSSDDDYNEEEEVLKDQTLGRWQLLTVQKFESYPLIVLR